MSADQLPGMPPEGEKDSIGRAFDAAKHRPEKDKIGRWKNLNRGGAPKGPRRARVTAPAAPSPGTSQPAAPAPSFDDIDRAARGGAAAAPVADAHAVVIDANPTAETVIGLIQTALVLLGDEEGLLTETEKMLLRAPLERVLQKYKVGKDVMPAEIDLVMALAGLLVTRLQKPKTATAWAKVKAWAVNLWFRGKGELLRREVAAVQREVAEASKP